MKTFFLFIELPSLRMTAKNQDEVIAAQKLAIDRLAFSLFS